MPRSKQLWRWKRNIRIAKIKRKKKKKSKEKEQRIEEWRVKWDYSVAFRPPLLPVCVD